MTRYKVILEYDGTNLIGWQENRQGPSVQSLLKDAIEKFCGARPDIIVCSVCDRSKRCEIKLWQKQISSIV